MKTAVGATGPGGTHDSTIPFGALMVERGYLTPEALQAALDTQRALATKQEYRSLPDVVVELGLATEADVRAALRR